MRVMKCSIRDRLSYNLPIAGEAMAGLADRPTGELLQTLIHSSSVSNRLLLPCRNYHKLIDALKHVKVEQFTPQPP